MDKRSLTPVIALAAGLAAAITVAAFQSVANAEARRKSADLDARIQQLDKENEAARTTEQALRAEIAQRTTEADQQARKLGELQTELDRIKNPPEFACFDSDQSSGADSIYVRGSVRSGGVTVTDHCRLAQLVEFSCIENPVGSGHFLVDSKIQDCPARSRRVEGECLR